MRFDQAVKSKLRIDFHTVSRNVWPEKVYVPFREPGELLVYDGNKNPVAKRPLTLDDLMAKDWH